MCWFKILDVTNQCFVEKNNSIMECWIVKSHVPHQKYWYNLYSLYNRMGKDGASNTVSWPLKSSWAKCKFCSNVTKIDRLTNCQDTRFQQSSREGKFLVAIGNLASHITVDTLVSYLRSLLCLWFLNRLSLTIPAFNVCIFAPNRPFAPEISQVLGIRNVFKKKKRIIDKLWFHCLSVGIVY